MRHRVTASLLLAVGLTIAPIASDQALASPSEDRLLPIDQHTSEKGRRLATTHAPALRAFNTQIYHCMPWVEVQRHSIGFFKPKHMAQEDRYLSVRIFVEQDPSPKFAEMRVEERASSMFSRYVGPLLRRLTRDPAIMKDPDIAGFSVVLEWLKQEPRRADGRPIHETIAVFIEKAAVADYLAGAAQPGHLVRRARVFGFDGETALGPLRLWAWDDHFVATYKVSNYQLAPGVTCP